MAGPAPGRTPTDYWSEVRSSDCGQGPRLDGLPHSASSGRLTYRSTWPQSGRCQWTQRSTANGALISCNGWPPFLPDVRNETMAHTACVFGLDGEIAAQDLFLL